MEKQNTNLVWIVLETNQSLILRPSSRQLQWTFRYKTWLSQIILLKSIWI